MMCNNEQCINPCSLRTSCGLNALCTPYNHKPRCSCGPGYTGNPAIACSEIPVCRISDDCSIGQTCVDGRCSLVSACASDHECQQGSICEAGKCSPGCRSHSDCDFTSACINAKCQNPCRFKTCGSNAQCLPINHESVCRCPEGFTGDANNYCSIEQEDCQSDESCGDGKICISNRCIIGCRSDSNCSPETACIQRKCREPCSVATCGHRALCRPVNHRAECACPPNFFGDARVQCMEKISADDVECSDSKECGPGKICKQNQCIREEDYRPECTSDIGCNPGEICENGNCLSGCRNDADCTYDKACINTKCISPCSQPNACGQNTDCTTIVHRPRCTCKAKHSGNPYDYCKLSKKDTPLECLSDEECSLGRVCDQGKCLDGCRQDSNCPSNLACINRRCLNPCDFPDSCGEQSTCVSVNHRPFCSCASGFTGDASVKCVPIVLPICLRDIDCGTGTICENGKCIDACRTDDTCPYTQSCINRRCQNPCSVFGACGKSLCQKEHRVHVQKVQK